MEKQTKDGQPKRASGKKVRAVQKSRPRRPQGKSKTTPAGRAAGVKRPKPPRASQGPQRKGPKVQIPKEIIPYGATIGPDLSVTINFRRLATASPMRFIGTSHYARNIAAINKLLGPRPSRDSGSPVLPMESPLGNTPALDHASMSVQAGAPTPQTGLSTVAMRYMKAVTAPFGAMDALPCVPILPAVQTFKTRTLRRGTMTTGTGLVGYIVACPYIGVNDTGKIAYTGSAWAGTTSTVFQQTAGGGVTLDTNPSLPYTAAQMAAGIFARLVGWGIRVRNISPALNVGGMVLGAQLPDGYGSSNFTPAQLFQRADSVVIPQSLQPASDWITMVYRPTTDALLGFQPDADYPSGAQFGIVICCIAPSGYVQSFEFEVVEYWEYMGGTGAVAVQNLTLGEADMAGAERVMNACQRLPLSLLQTDWNAQMANGIVDDVAHSDTIAKTVEAIAGHVGGLAKAIWPMAKSIFSFLGI